ncbi:MAG: TadE/TadG family type IV pilus assembly protein [Actinomycetota bacterium]
MDRFKEERGAIAVLTALTIVILFAAVAFVIDISRLYHERQVLQNAVDFGALAGAQDLPVQGSAQANIASQIARTVAIANAPQVATSGLTITYQCVVGDRNGDGLPDPEDIPFVCGPTAGTWSTGWTTKNGRSTHLCDPFAGDKCNTIRLTTSNSIPYYFAPVIGINTGSTGAVNAASCKGACGAASSPLDIVLVLDRTGSMTPADVANVKNAALSILGFYDSSQQWVGLVALPYGQSGNKCNVNNPQTYPDPINYTDWQVVPLSKDYTRADGTLNTSSAIVTSINCLVRSPTVTVTVNGTNQTNAGHTNLGDPLYAARLMLAAQGRPTVPDVIIFETDGQANQPNTMNPCNYFNTAANVAKAAGQTIFTIAYGLDNPPVKCDFDTSGPFVGKYATYNLAGAATQPSPDDVPGGCGVNENKDGDHYFCTPGSSDLEPVFRQVAAATIETAHLVDT